MDNFGVCKIDKGLPFRDVTNTNHVENDVKINQQMPVPTAKNEVNDKKNNIMAKASDIIAHKYAKDNKSDRQLFLQQCSRNFGTLIKEIPLQNLTFLWQFEPTIPIPNGVLEQPQPAIKKIHRTKKTKINFNLNVLINKIPRAENLSLVKRDKNLYGFAALIQLHNLARLDIHIDSTLFAEFPNAIEYDQPQQLEELNMSMSNLIITKEFCQSFERFVYLNRLTLFIGPGVVNSQDLLLHFGRMAGHSKLRTLLLAGNLDGLRLDVNYFEIAYIRNVFVCTNKLCDCPDHAKMP